MLQIFTQIPADIFPGILAGIFQAFSASIYEVFAFRSPPGILGGCSARIIRRHPIKTYSFTTNCKPYINIVCSSRVCIFLIFLIYFNGPLTEVCIVNVIISIIPNDVL